MFDSFGRDITYLRLSVTDRCNLRCLYCMPDDAELLPRCEVLSLEELERLAGIFIRLGIRKLRLTGGEPLVRRGVESLVRALGRHVAAGRLEELTLTTNGTRLVEHAEALRAAGVRRINVSLDSLDPDRFRRITGRDDLPRALAGIAAAAAAGLEVKINTVVLKGENEDEIDDLIRWGGAHGHDITLIETMPLGRLAGCHRDWHVPLDEIRRRIAARWTLQPSRHRTGGPARFFAVAETGRRLGFIAAVSHGFCSECNRVRLTCTGTLTPCLGSDAGVELRPILRRADSDLPVETAILAGVAAKPRGHGFAAAGVPLFAGQRTRMCRTGG
ncbi:Cyclic pyranopterin monophosphate synthase [uncultured Alphaproteobacteria bacterium]|uniref:GTP 3',8-cyclase n=1 Tax=uncultured Alphaproteobacteria bacterium TaxID=91750 RepID=A0A212K3Q3_9PROT|nr:Cyclic pyranopterin monophosphate synthase [uncultured Alphaproteobacteria bacterium]